MTVAPLTMTLEEFLLRDDLPEEAELVLGNVVLPMPESPRHFLLTSLMERELAKVSGGVHVARETPLNIPNDGQPRPDVVVFDRAFEELLLVGDFDARSARIVIEISMTTAALDLGFKEEQYAKAGIPEYVVLEISKSKAIVHTDPTPLGYARRRYLTAADEYRGVPLAPFLS